jgi:hypothetical protein
MRQFISIIVLMCELQRASRRLCPKISRLDLYHRGKKLAKALDRDQSSSRTHISRALISPETMLTPIDPFEPFSTCVRSRAAEETDCACSYASIKDHELPRTYRLSSRSQMAATNDSTSNPLLLITIDQLELMDNAASLGDLFPTPEHSHTFHHPCT